MRKVLIVTAIIALAAVAAAVIAPMAGNYLTAHSSAAQCANGTHATHTITISDNKMTPNNVRGNLCDKLIITNNDAVIREVAFGPHEQHTAYDGITEQLLTQGQSLQVTLVQSGTFEVHDHLHDDVTGQFSVTK